MFFRPVKQMAEREGVTEQLKAEDQMKWVALMNNIRSRAMEIINTNLIYIEHTKSGQSSMLCPLF